MAKDERRCFLSPSNNRIHDHRRLSAKFSSCAMVVYRQTIQNLKSKQALLLDSDDLLEVRINKCQLGAFR
jgi:hypothetical protein